MSDPAIQISKLSLSLSGKAILRDVSLDVRAGEFVSIIGPNGAGKTSLVKCVSRIHQDWSGEVRINGRDLRHCSQKELARQLSYVPQAEGRRLPFTAFEFVLMGRYPHLSPFSSVTAADKELVREMMALAGVEGFADRSLESLSGGERQMVFIAAALAQGGSMLLLDEPASFLDYKHQMQVMELTGKLHRDQGLTIVCVSHDVNAACAQSDRVLAMKHGEVEFVGTPAEVLEEGRLEELYETTFDRIAGDPLPFITPGRMK
ncbi:MAG: ABC transporter ATP-binding protein [Verrucomicrobiota bacterium JB025]|nr:ABC transporter ATP-binding protein [Verrucomicrobiota bacterium JB025]